ncbi:MAG: hypothetical protein ACPGJV_00825 [Bacteriovoracaceae bacterium]
MIHNNSTDPVFIKKIHLEVWTLREEIEFSVEQAALNHQDDQAQLFAKIKKIQDEYNSNKTAPSALAEVTPLSAPTEAAENQETPEQDGENPEQIEASAEESSEENSDETPEERPEDNLENNPDEEASEAQSADAEGNEDAEQAPEGETPFEEVPSGNVTEFPASEAMEGLTGAAENADNLLLFQKRPPLPEQRKFRGMTILAEITMEGIYFFSDQNLLSGQNIVLDFLVPRRFLIQAEVVFCRPYNMRSRIISNSSLPFRCGARFTFNKEGQRTLLREFLETIEPDYVPQAKPKKVAKVQEENHGDMDDLDDLDL